MDWPIILVVAFACIFLLMATGMPIAIVFLLVSVVGSFAFWGGMAGLNQLAMSISSSVTHFTFLPVPLFILMGAIIGASGIGSMVLDALDKLIGRVPGRLSLIAITAGAVLGAVSGVSGGSIAIIGKALLPDMLKRRYQGEMSIGPIVATGTLATMIPPSALAVFLAAIGGLSASHLLLGITVPGLMLSVMFVAYIIIRCMLQPHLAPPYEVSAIPLRDKLMVVATNVLPLSVIIFSVTGVIFFGIATPTESAALGVMGCCALAAAYRKLNWNVLKEASKDTIWITGMIFIIVVSAVSFSRILASSGALRDLIQWSTSLDVHPAVIVILTQIVVLVLGMFFDPASIVMLTVPIFVPLVQALGFDPLWYSIMLLLNIQLGLITPPFGLDVYTAKAAAPPEITLDQVFRASMPYLALGLLMMVMIWFYPEIALWLPRTSR